MYLLSGNYNKENYDCLSFFKNFKLFILEEYSNMKYLVNPWTGEIDRWLDYHGKFD